MAVRPITVNGITYKGSSLTAQRLRADKHNQLFMANLKIAMMAVPKYVLGTYAATMLDQAVKQTKGDSSRFAANWNLAFTGEPLEKKPSPLEYGESGPKFGTIGEKAYKGRYRMAVRMTKRAYYGYKKGANGYMALTKGRLAQLLYPRASGMSKNSKGVMPSGDMSGAAAKIVLYNSFMKPDQRIGNWFPLKWPGSRGRKGKSYAHYAMGLGAGEMTGAPRGGGMLKGYLYEMQSEMRKATAAGQMLDPRGVSIR